MTVSIDTCIVRYVFSAENAERELTNYRQTVTDRDAMVRRALAAGLTKHRIHVLTGISRSTLDRIPQEDPMSIRIIELTDPTYLHLHYANTDGEQPAYIILDLDAMTLSATADAEPGSPTRRSESTGHERRYLIPALTADAANRVMHAILPLAQRVATDWDIQSNSQGTPVVVLSADGQVAEREIVEYLGCEESDPGYAEVDLIEERDVEELTDLAELGLTGTTTDAELEEVEARVHDELDNPGRVTVWNGLAEYLEWKRDEMAAESE